ncbi:shikimate dehydrogenase [Candidatus Steffania adelgidicola]|uniref:shikimate dehydrogenase n=1 Tax=Candidatus Steffania adelgidicola TaxID=1076626 RepID=UPI001D00E781|nr:shikimate dehydrogenase [Candidatus Steffania adelgidicola]UDG79630.1 Shikimate dehydrogenase (NADP(+)) [Candidatus Steffania adelgidicola]
MDAFSVFGNPINHSQSPRIYALFSGEIGLSHSYARMLSPIEGEIFEKMLHQFFNMGGLGANITLPFKERAYALCNQLTKRAALAGTVNTIKKQMDGLLLGDNTDGIGLLNDLQRLNLLKQDSRVLLVGAGGAAKGVILPLLDYGCTVVLTNRTFARAKALEKYYQDSGDIIALPLPCLNTPDYDIIINATSTGIKGTIPPLSTSIITPEVYCYDMFYQEGDTPFLKWCHQQGARFCSDGLGMLVEQAASSFLFWHNIMPSVLPVLKTLRLELTQRSK